MSVSVIVMSQLLKSRSPGYPAISQVAFSDTCPSPGGEITILRGGMTRSLLLEHKREIYDRYGREGLTGAGRWSGGGVPGWKWVREGEAGQFLQSMLFLRFLAMP